MKLEKKIVIEEADISALHAEVVGVLDFVAETATHGNPLEFLQAEFPALSRLRGILDGLIVSEQSTRVFDRLGGSPEDAPRARRNKLKVVRTCDSPDPL